MGKPRAAVLVLAVALTALCRTTGAQSGAQNARAGATALDLDGDGQISQAELARSKFFQETDLNGDGTIEASEIRGYIRRFGGGELFGGDIELDRGISDALKDIDTDSTDGVQGADIVKHWARLDSLLTVEDVADWISNAVLLPQYAEAFRDNGVKGFDLPLFMEDPNFLKEIGVHTGLHRKQIMRSISMRLLGLGRAPPKPLLDCVPLSDNGGEGAPQEWLASLSWSIPANRGGDAASIPVHRWRVSWKLASHKRWIPLAAYDGSEAGAEVALPISIPGGANPAIRVEAWNAIGRSEGAVCALALRGEGGAGGGLGLLDSRADAFVPAPALLPKYTALAALTGSGNARATASPSAKRDFLHGATEQVFRIADLDGDGDIDADELAQLISGLNDPVAADKEPVSEVAGAELRAQRAQNDFLKSSGVESGIRSVDGDADRSILPEELESHWTRLQRLITVEQTRDWIAHAVGLPQYGDAIVDQGITGFDLPALIANDGEQLEKRLRVADPRDKRLLVRAITVLVMGIGEPPHPLTHVDARPGEVKCGSIQLDWSASARANARASEMPVHKYRVLRRRTDASRETPWDEVYTGMSTSVLDKHLRVGVAYDYRVEAWNLLGASPPFESHQVKPNKQACITVMGVVAKAAYLVATFPFFLLGVLVDNYYRITALLSAGGFVVMFSNVPFKEKRRILHSLRERIVPLLKSSFGTAFGTETALRFLVKWLQARNERSMAAAANAGREPGGGGHARGSPGGYGEEAEEDEDDSDLLSPASPHHDMISRAVEATFPTTTSSKAGGVGQRSAKEPKKHGRGGTAGRLNAALGVTTVESLGSGLRTSRPSTPNTSHDSKWGVIRRHIMTQRVVKAWERTVNDSSTGASSDTDSSVNSFGSPKAVGRKSRLRFFHRKKRRSIDSLEPSASAPSSVLSAAATAASSSSAAAAAAAAATTSQQSHDRRVPPIPMAAHHTMSGHLEGSTKACAYCGTSVKKFTRHVCGRCHQVFCEQHTLVKPHSRLFQCGVESKCICVECHNR